MEIKRIPVIPENAPFDAAQRLWLNGFLAGLFAAEESSAPANNSAPSAPAQPLLIVFGSQTGTAQTLAKRFAKEAKEKGLNSRIVQADEAVKLDWQTEKNLLVVTSTYGDGDMPDNAQAFWDWLRGDAAKGLSHLNFSVLALGDSNYEHFCAAGKKIDTRLEELGAKRVHPRTDCDVDYEACAKEWFSGVLAALTAAASTPAGQPASPALDEKGSLEAVPAGYGKSNPFPARLLTNRVLTGDGSGKEVRHFEISLQDSGMEYEVGDALGVYPANCPSLVEEFLHALACDGEEAVPCPGGGEVSFRKALQDCYDITKPGAELLKRAAEHHSVLRDLLAPDRKQDLKSWLWGREVIDLFLETPGLSLAPAEFVCFLKPLASRLYSISSSPKAHAGQVHLTVSIVRHNSAGRGRKGVCSTFLADRVGTQAPVPVFVQQSHGFRLPPSGETPIIMVGPGTGVAPFRAFLHERQAVGAKGRNWLFFGEQRAATDFYYREELQSMLTHGHLNKLCTAFSRDQADKIYVQNRMLENAGTLWAWLQEGAHFYVCGDASRMAKDVDEALHQIARSEGALSGEAAEAYVKQMKADKRYQRDVY
jgi:sulfite reductase (NADPH) flavoprotein alpha-component